MGFLDTLSNLADRIGSNLFVQSSSAGTMRFMTEVASAVGAEDELYKKHAITDAVVNTSEIVTRPIRAAGTGVMSGLEWYAENIQQPVWEGLTLPIREELAAWRIARREAVRRGFEPGSWEEWRLILSQDEDVYGEAQRVAKDTTLGQAVSEALISSTLAMPGSGALREAEVAGVKNRFAMTDEEIRRLRDRSIAYQASSHLIDFVGQWYTDPLLAAGKVGKAAQELRIRPVRPGEDIARAFEEGRGRVFRRSQTLWSDRTKGWGAHDFIVGSEAIRRSTNPMAFGTALEYANRLEGVERVETMKLVQRIALGDQKALAEIRRRQPELADMLRQAQARYDEAVDVYKYTRGLDADPQLTLFDDKLRPIDLTEDVSLKAEAYKKRAEAYKKEVGEIQRQLDFLDFLDQNVFGVGSGSVAQVTRRGARAVERRYRPRETQIYNSPWGVPFRVVSWGKGAFSLKQMRANGFVDLDAPDSYKEVDALLQSTARLFPKTYSPEVHRRLVNEFTSAVGPGQKVAVLQKIEASIMAQAAAEYDLPAPLVKVAYQQFVKERARLLKGDSGNRLFSAAPSPDIPNATADMVMVDGQLTHLPWSPTQNKGPMPMLDTEVLKKTLAQNAQRLKDEIKYLEDNGIKLEDALNGRVIGDPSKVVAAREWVADMLDRFGTLWKGATLLRLGYPARNVLESNLRTYAKFGSAANLLYLEGIANFAQNAVSRIPARRRLAQIIQDEVLYLDDLRAVRAQREIEGATKDELDQLAAAIAEQEGKVNRLKTAKTKDLLKEYGLVKSIETSGVQTALGTIEGPFSGAEGPLRKQLAATRAIATRLLHEGRNDTVFRERLLDQARRKGEEATAYRMMMNWGRPKTYTPDDELHSEQWIHVVNFQFRNDKLLMGDGKFKGILGGATDKEALRWLRGTAAGREHLRQLDIVYQRNPEHLVANARATAEYYLPTEDLRRIALNRELTRHDVDTWKAQDGNIAPNVHGPDAAFNLGKGGRIRTLTDPVMRALDWISTAPENKLARHPHYVAAYRAEVKRQAELLANDPARKALGKDGVITIEELQGVIKKRAHEYALKSLKETLYDASTRSNAAHTLRWISPFFAAQQNSLEVWWNLAKDDPSLLGKANLIWQIPANAGVVIDENGNIVEGREYTESDAILLALPGWLGGPENERDLDKGVLKVFDARAKMNLETFNVIFPGQPWWSPGVGPVVALPLSWVREQMPDYDDIYEQVDPYGPAEKGPLAFLPSGWRRVVGLIREQDDVQFGKYVLWMHMQDLAEWEMNGRVGPRPREKEAVRKVQALYGLKILSLFGSPFQVNFEPKFEFARAHYRTLEEQARRTGKDEAWVFQQFRKEYPEVLLLLAQSTSKNNTGLATSAEALNAKRAHQALLNKYAGKDPSLTAGIVGVAGQKGEFSSSAYSASFSESIVEGGTVKMRERLGPEELEKKNYANLGWDKYRRVMDLIDAYAARQGLTSWRESEELTELRRQVVDELKRENPDWWAEYDNGFETFDRRYVMIEQIAADPLWRRFPERSDITTLQKYVALRRMFQQELDRRAAAGGGKTMTAQANADLQQLWAVVVDELVESDTQFSSNWYHRYLETDPWLRGLTEGPGE